MKTETTVLKTFKIDIAELLEQNNIDSTKILQLGLSDDRTELVVVAQMPEEVTTIVETSKTNSTNFVDALRKPFNLKKK